MADIFDDYMDDSLDVDVVIDEESRVLNTDRNGLQAWSWELALQILVPNLYNQLGREFSGIGSINSATPISSTARAEANKRAVDLFAKMMSVSSRENKYFTLRVPQSTLTIGKIPCRGARAGEYTIETTASIGADEFKIGRFISFGSSPSSVVSNFNHYKIYIVTAISDMKVTIYPSLRVDISSTFININPRAIVEFDGLIRVPSQVDNIVLVKEYFDPSSLTAPATRAAAGDSSIPSTSNIPGASTPKTGEIVRTDRHYFIQEGN